MEVWELQPTYIACEGHSAEYPESHGNCVNYLFLFPLFTQEM